MMKAQVRAARALLGWSQEELASRASVSVATIRRQEPGAGEFSASSDVLARIASALESAGVELITGGNLEGHGVRFSRPSDRDRLTFVLQAIQGAEKLLRSAQIAAATSIAKSVAEDLDQALSAIQLAAEKANQAIETIDDFEDLMADLSSDGTSDGINVDNK
ncbi:helix-turn-helix transcriptional regulator [Xanthobacter autotrophicus]|jgi:transcriptional regulator with XRE-family HTH domain|uniref:helix-turn-helix transcriptional regulator n=1 Tax=Xanthobacter autotrophicus TaxID=280 RepID=UPI0037263907